jgi:hypothetical protein
MTRDEILAAFGPALDASTAEDMLDVRLEAQSHAVELHDWDLFFELYALGSEARQRRFEATNAPQFLVDNESRLQAEYRDWQAQVASGKWLNPRDIPLGYERREGCECVLCQRGRSGQRRKS